MKLRLLTALLALTCACESISNLNKLKVVDGLDTPLTDGGLDVPILPSTCKPTLPDAKCDPIAQCGCAANASCTVLGTTDAKNQYTAQCRTAGKGKVGDTCEGPSDCSPGLLCNSGAKTCANYCKSDLECGTGLCFPLRSDLADTGFGVCLAACDRTTGKPCSAGNACAHFNAPLLVKKIGDFCTAPLQADECAQDDNVCDEPAPKGTGFCVAGADPGDCSCKPAGGGECDPIKQCGCESKPNTHCQTHGSTAGTCVPVGTLAPDSMCKTSSQCPRGQDCVANVCRKYCGDIRDCGPQDLCNSLLDKAGKEIPTLGVCVVGCDFVTGTPCAAGTLCARFGSRAFCYVPDSPCPTTGDGICDDTRSGGTRACAMGTDAADCNK